jgi:hypothetical protein
MPDQELSRAGEARIVLRTPPLVSGATGSHQRWIRHRCCHQEVLLRGVDHLGVHSQSIRATQRRKGKSTHHDGVDLGPETMELWERDEVLARRWESKAWSLLRVRDALVNGRRPRSRKSACDPLSRTKLRRQNRVRRWSTPVLCTNASLKAMNGIARCAGARRDAQMGASDSAVRLRPLLARIEAFPPSCWRPRPTASAGRPTYEKQLRE